MLLGGQRTTLRFEPKPYCWLCFAAVINPRADDMTESLVLRTLRLAVKERQPQPGLIHHSDRGGQYVGNEYRSVLRRAKALQSMSRAGDC